MKPSIYYLLASFFFLAPPVSRGQSSAILSQEMIDYPFRDFEGDYVINSISDDFCHADLVKIWNRGSPEDVWFRLTLEGNTLPGEIGGILRRSKGMSLRTNQAGHRDYEFDVASRLSDVSAHALMFRKESYSHRRRIGITFSKLIDGDFRLQILASDANGELNQVIQCDYNLSKK